MNNINHSTLTFSDIGQKWLEYKSTIVKISTYEKYYNIFNKYLKDFIGKMTIDELAFTKQQINICKETNISDSLKSSIYSVVNQIISYANANYDCSLMHYKCTRRYKRKPVEIFSPIEQQQLIKNIFTTTNRKKIGIYVCLSTGLRLGEVCSLKWSDIDFDNKMLYVNRTVTRVRVNNGIHKTALIELEPKSVSSKRIIPLSDDLICQLRNYYTYKTDYLLLPHKHMDPRNYQKYFATFLMDAGIGKRNFHILRHTFATNCIDSGIDVKSLSEILGHADVNITLNRYVHPSIETKRKYLNVLSKNYQKYIK